MMSAAPAAVWNAGTVNVSSGSITDATGKSAGDIIGSFSSVSGFEITPPASYSLPVAAVVRTVKIGSARPIFE